MPTTAEQQLALELINQARLDPEGEYDRLVTNASPAVQSALTQFGVDLVELASQFDDMEAVAALAWSETLETSATNQNDLMNEFDVQSHFVGDQVNDEFIDRFLDAGYTGWQTVGENIFAHTTDPDFAHAGFYIDWGNTPTGIQTPAGHRESIMNGNFTEVGVGWTAADPTNTVVGPYITTQHFGTTFNYETKLLGVVIDDLDNDDFYDIGEGMGGVTVSAVGTSGEGTFVTTSWASGGYQMALPDGVYTVTFSGGAMTGSYTVTVTMAGENVKVDAEADDVSGGMILVGDAGNNVLTGGIEADTISGDNGRDTLNGGAGDDDLSGDKGHDTLNGGDDNDTLDGGRGNDTLNGGEGDDILMGGLHNDRLLGEDGDDDLYGGEANDKIFGGEGSDDMFGGTGNDSLYGGNGNDTIDAGDNADFVNGGNGNDNLSGGIAADVISGGSGNDIVNGDAGHDTLKGNRGDDTLTGGTGRDKIFGGDDNDIITGGDGADTLYGGSGDDTFIFAVGDDKDIIMSVETNDTLQFSNALANGSSAADLASGADITSGSAVIVFDSGDELTLDGFTDLVALEAMISIV